MAGPWRAVAGAASALLLVGLCYHLFGASLSDASGAAAAYGAGAAASAVSVFRPARVNIAKVGRCRLTLSNPR